MTISGDNAISQLASALANNASRFNIQKASIANAAAGQFQSLWRATGQPGQGAIPTAVAVCSNAIVGALPFTQQIAPATSYLGILEGLCTNLGTTLEIRDRLVHQGGLNGTLTTAQSVNLDLSTLLATSNLDARKGDANYSDVQWWLEWYTDTGATVANVTVNAKFDDGTNADLVAFSIAATRRASSAISLNTQIAAAQAGKYIRGVNSVTLSISTGSAGNFGVTATRYRAGMYKPVANARFTNNWADLGLPEIHNQSCLFPMQIASTTSTGVVNATGKIAHG